MLKNFLVITFVLCFLLCLSDKTQACTSGFSSTVKSSFSSADAVFVGKVTEIKTTQRANLSWFLKEAESLEPNKTPRLDKYFEKVDYVRFEVIESFKGVSGKTFELVTPLTKNSCFTGISFLVGDSYLVFARRTPSFSSIVESNESEKLTAAEVRLVEEADGFNTPLLSYETTSLSGTINQRIMEKKVELIRDFVKTGGWSGAQKNTLPMRILY
jgi:hypothetical protein